jgi:hypothetical protein
MIDTDWADQMEITALGGDRPSSLHADLIAYFRQKTGCTADEMGVRAAQAGPAAVSIANLLTQDHLILFTSGMSARPMTVPDGQEELQFAELVMFLPRDWPVRPPADSPESAPWKWLQFLARYPHEYDTWLGGPFSTISTDDLPASQVEGCPYTAFMLLYNQHFASFEASDGRRINLISVIPLIPKHRKWQRCQPPAPWQSREEQ